VLSVENGQKHLLEDFVAEHILRAAESDIAKFIVSPKAQLISVKKVSFDDHL
jgi:hypothetical protein